MSKALSRLIMHLAVDHHQDADTLVMAHSNGDLLNMHRRMHEVMHQNGDAFHRNEVTI